MDSINSTIWNFGLNIFHFGLHISDGLYKLKWRPASIFTSMSAAYSEEELDHGLPFGKKNQFLPD